MATDQNYIILSPCYNEQHYIEFSIKSALLQTRKPLGWIIVDDGSMDATAEVIKSYATEHNFIQYYCRRKPEGQAYFASNVQAIMAGYDQIKHLDFSYLAILDADITLPEDYYETIISRMEQDKELGIASGIYENLVDGRLEPVINDRRSTPKAIMLFRRECFEQIGGFLPLAWGGEDTAACVTARMKGWKVWSFPDIKVVHHRPTGTGKAGKVLKVRLNQGRAEWAMGSHWLFVLIKCGKRALKEKPYIIGGLCRWLGFLQGCWSREKRIVSDEFVKFFRKEQLGRILKLNRV